jgi:3-oxoacyl-[acyl-carrier protein] reductase
MKDLAGKTVLVTGAGRGIGKAIALAFAAEKSRLVITGRTAAALDRVAAEIDRRDAELMAVTCDVTEKNQVENLQRQIESRFGAVQILVNNVGIAPAADFLEMQDSLWEEVMRVNLNAAYNCCKTFLRPDYQYRFDGRAGCLPANCRLCHIETCSSRLDALSGDGNRKVGRDRERGVPRLR